MTKFEEAFQDYSNRLSLFGVTVTKDDASQDINYEDRHFHLILTGKPTNKQYCKDTLTILKEKWEKEFDLPFRVTFLPYG